MKCQNCSKETNNPKFCSKSCSVSSNNKISPKRKKQNILIKFCVVCNTQLNKQKKFCSQKCQGQFIWICIKEKINKTGIIHSKGKFHSSSTAKKYISELYGNKCSICQQENIWNNKPLIMILDHINGIPDDWNVSNLRLVCPNCDTQLDTYKSKNKNGGRPSRRI